jgi:capsular polysaccharide transport system permease protein
MEMQVLSPPLAASPVQGPVRFRWPRVLFALVVREMSTKFGRSWGGYLWAIAEPVGGILLLTFIFGLALRKPPLGTNFALFYASGIIPFFLFSKVTGSVAGAIDSNRGLLTYPVVQPLDAVFAKFITDFLTMLVVGALLYSFLILYYGLPVSLDVAAIFNGFLLMGLLGLGFGTMNCVIYGFWPTWKHIWNVLTKPLFFLSGMFYTYESLPPRAQSVLWYNPLFQAVGLTRAGIYSGYDPVYISPAYVLGISLGCFTVGAYLLRRHSSRLLER